MHWGMGFSGFGWLFMVVFWVLVIIGVVYVIKMVMNGTKSGGKTEAALDILKKRYTQEELNKEEFEEKKRELL